jgi:hypothetical protein
VAKANVAPALDLDKHAVADLLKQARLQERRATGDYSTTVSLLVPTRLLNRLSKSRSGRSALVRRALFAYFALIDAASESAV